MATNQGIQFPIVELSTQAEMLRLLILKTAVQMDGMTQKEIERDIGDKVSMCNVGLIVHGLHWQSPDRTSTGPTDYVHKLRTERCRYMVGLATPDIKGRPQGVLHWAETNSKCYLSFEHIYRHHSRFPTMFNDCFDISRAISNHRRQ